MSLIKSLNNSVTIIFILLLSNLGQASDAGKIWPSEKKTWIDPEFGHEITQWTQNSAQSWHLYFNIESFIDEHHAIIFSERNGSLQLYNLDLNSKDKKTDLIAKIQADPAPKEPTEEKTPKEA